MIIRRAGLPAIALLSMVFCDQILAQDAGPLEPGDVVRLQTGDTTVTGSLVLATASGKRSRSQAAIEA